MLSSVDQGDEEGSLTAQDDMRRLREEEMINDADKVEKRERERERRQTRPRHE